jgi:hypothetical protein
MGGKGLFASSLLLRQLMLRVARFGNPEGKERDQENHFQCVNTMLSKLWYLDPS